MLGLAEMTFLKECLPFWKQLEEGEKQMLMASATPRHFEQGQAMHGGERSCAGVYLVKSGQVRCYIFSEAGKEITLYRLFERDICIFSASCMMRNIRFTIFVEAEKATDAILIPTEVYHQLSESSLPVADYTNQLMSARFSEVMWMMEQVLFMSFDKRLAIFLLEQAGIEGSDTLHMTQETMAKHLGSAREVVTRMLKYFQQEGIVDLFRGGVTITDRKKLERLAE